MQQSAGAAGSAGAHGRPGASPETSNPVASGGDAGDKEQRKAEKRQRKEEKRLAKALEAARAGIEGAAGGDDAPDSDEGEGEGDGSGDDKVAGEGKKRKNDEAGLELGKEEGRGKRTRNASKAPVSSSSDKTGKDKDKDKSKPKGKDKDKGKGRAAPVPEATAAEEEDLPADEKLQELANAVVSGAIYDYANSTHLDPAEVDAIIARGAEAALQAENDAMSGAGAVPAQAGQTTTGQTSDFTLDMNDFDAAALDPRLADVDDFDLASIWQSTRRAVPPPAPAPASASADASETAAQPLDSSSFLAVGDEAPSTSTPSASDAKAAAATGTGTGAGATKKDKKARPAVPGTRVRAGAKAAGEGAGAGAGAGAGDVSNEFAAPKRTRRGEPKGPTDAELEARFKDPNEMNAFIADRWLPTSELIRLENAGIISYKKGKFSIEEVEAIRKHIEEFKLVHRVTDDVWSEMVIALGKKVEHPRFWNDIAAVVPGRPVRFVQKYVKRVYDPRARQGPWTQAEDRALEQACFANPGQWTKIASAVGRTEDDCRTRWRDELRHRDDRLSGRWHRDEEKQLTDIVKRLNVAAGKDALARDAPWEAVVKEMGGTRTTMQCRKKWHDQLMPSLKASDGRRDIMHKRDRLKLVDAIKSRKYAREEHIDFPAIALESFGMEDYHPARAMWRRIKSKVEGAEELSLEVLLGRMRGVLSAGTGAGGAGFKSPAILSDGEEEEERDDDEGGEGEGVGAARSLVPAVEGSGSGQGVDGNEGEEGVHVQPEEVAVAEQFA